MTLFFFELNNIFIEIRLIMIKILVANKSDDDDKNPLCVHGGFIIATNRT